MLRLGFVERSLGGRDAAVRALRGALVLQPRHGIAHIGIVQAMPRQGSYADPRTLLRAGLAVDPGGVETLFALNHFLEHEGRLEEQVRRHVVLLLHVPGNAHVLANFGVLRRRQARFDEGRVALCRAIRAAPGDADHRYSLATVHLSTGASAEALRLQRQSVLLAPTMAIGWLAISRLELAFGHVEAARRAGTAAFRLAPAHRNIVSHYARVLFRAGRADLAGPLYAADLPAGRRIEMRRSFLLDRWCASAGLPCRTIDRPDAAARRHAELRQPYVARLTGAIALAGEWIVADQGHAVFIEQMCHSINYLPFTRKYVLAYLDESRVVVAMPEAARRIDRPAVLVGGGAGNYFHWLIDHLGRLALIDGEPDAAELPLLVDASLSQFQRDSLARLGYGPERLIGVEAPGAVICRDLVVPSLGGYLSRIEPIVVDWLRRRFQAPERPAGRRRRLLVSRRGAGQRRLANEAELYRALGPLGIEVVNPADMSFAAQRETFAAAELIIGAHGAGLTNMLFAPPDARVVDLNFGAGPIPCYEDLARLIGQPYQRLMGEAVTTSRLLPQSADFVVDAAAALAPATALLDGPPRDGT